MFKRVERKRKRREEEEELGLDEDAKRIMGLNDTDSDESDSESEQESAQSDPDSDAAIGEDGDQGEDAISEDEGVDEDPPISVEEALKDPIYLVSLKPNIHGCVLCRGKLLKNAGMAAAHKAANAHKRRLDHFRSLSTRVDPSSSAWELVRVVQSASGASRIRKEESLELSKRASKRQVKQAAVHEKRKRHKELKTKAIAKKALDRLSAAEETGATTSSKANLQCQNHQEKARKKQKLASKFTTKETRDKTTNLASRTKLSSDVKMSVLKSRNKSTRKADKGT